MSHQLKLIDGQVLDEVDLRLIAALQADGRKSYSELSQDLDIPTSTVRYRLQRLLDNEALQVVGIADPLKIGFDRLTLIGINCDPTTAPKVCEDLAKLPETSYVVLTSGSFDVIAEVVCKDIKHYSDLLFNRLQVIPGVRSTESFFVLETHKLAYGWGVGDVKGVPTAEDVEAARIMRNQE